MSEPEIFRDIVQGTPEWFAARLGLPTASMFATVLASGKGGGESLTRKKYLNQLAGEVITGEPMETFSNVHMERGRLMEAQARDFYALMTDTAPEQVGFVRWGRKGCSPDSLIGNDGMLEIKTAMPSVLIPLIMRDEFPPDHVAQTQGNLLVADREWIDISIHWPKFPPFIKRAYRRDAYLAHLSQAIDQFNDELDAIVERIRAYGRAA